MSLGLPATYVDHLVSPHHRGDVEGAHAAGEAGSMVGGLGVRITLAYEAEGNGDARIAQAAGRAFGTSAAIAPLSYVCDQVRAQSPAAALALSTERVLESLGDGEPSRIPERVRLATGLVITALRRALGDADAGAPANPAGPGILVCRCLGVGDHEVRSAIRAGAHEPEAIGDACLACTGCRSCRPDLLALIDEETREPPPTPDTAAPQLVRILGTRAAEMLRALGYQLERIEPAADHVAIGIRQVKTGHPETTPMGATALVHHLLREVAGVDLRVELFEGS